MKEVQTNGNNPFPGLRPYEPSESSRFFGRDADLGLITTRLLSGRTTLLFAGSGVGKTSFLEAKLTPELSRRFLVISHREWAGRSPLIALIETVVRALNKAGASISDRETLVDYFHDASASTAVSQRRFVLILDQFEELFQHHRDTSGLSEFVSGLSALISDNGVDIRVVFSMREEFLGELSVFDNLIADVFNNYYRLKNLDESQARDVIEQTVGQSEVSPDGIKAVLHDLRSLHNGEQKGERAIRKYIAPPYLQLVCNQIWADTEPLQNHTPFLADYAPGTARGELQKYCRKHLETLSGLQKALACDAFGFLMTKRGAKMAYASKDLADLMRVDERELKPVLNKLASPSVRILRAFGDPVWFELYHDMYAPFLIRWKSGFDTARKRQLRRLEAEAAEQRLKIEADQKMVEAKEKVAQREKALADQRKAELERFARRQWRVRAMFALGALIVAALLSFWTLGYRANQELKVLKEACANLKDPTRAGQVDHRLVEQAHAYLNAYGQVFEWFSKTPPRRVWSEYWDLRVEQKAVAGLSDDAFLVTLASLESSQNNSIQRQRLAAALAANYSGLRNTYRASEQIAGVQGTTDGHTLIGVLRSGRIQRWNADTGQPIGTTTLDIAGSETSSPGDQKNERRPPSRTSYAPNIPQIAGISPDGRYLLAGLPPPLPPPPKLPGPGGVPTYQPPPAFIDFKLFDVATGQSLNSSVRMSYVPGGVERAVFSPLATTVVLLTSAEATVCSIGEASKISKDKVAMVCQSFGTQGGNPYLEASFSESGNQVALLRERDIEIWDISQVTAVKKTSSIDLPADQTAVFGPNKILFLDNDTLLVSVEFQMFRVDVRNGRFISKQHDVIDFMPSSDHKTIVTVGNTPNIGFLDAATLEAAKGVVPWPVPSVDQLANRPWLSPDGESLFTVGSTSIVRRWKIGHGPPLAPQLPKVEERVTSAAINAEGSLLAVVNWPDRFTSLPQRYTIHVYQLPGYKLMYETTVTQIVADLRLVNDGALFRSGSLLKFWKFGSDIVSLENMGYAGVITTSGTKIGIGQQPNGLNNACNVYATPNLKFETEIQNCVAIAFNATGHDLIALRPDGKLSLMTIKADNRSWETKQVITLSSSGSYSERVRDLSFGPGASRLITSSENGWTIWDIKNPAHPTKVGSWVNIVNPGFGFMPYPGYGAFTSKGNQEVLDLTSGWLHQWSESGDGSVVLNNRPLPSIPVGGPALVGENSVQYPETTEGGVAVRTLKMDLSDVPPLERGSESWKDLRIDWEKRLSLRVTPDMSVENQWQVSQ
jgi:WD40 repeat protein